MIIIKKLINWSLLNNNEVIIHHKNVECDYNNNTLEFVEKDGYNFIDFDNNYYKRENNDHIVKLDFNENIMYYHLKEKKQDFKINFDGNITINDNIIKIKYCIDKEEKEIIIRLL